MNRYLTTLVLALAAALTSIAASTPTPNCDAGITGRTPDAQCAST